MSKSPPLGNEAIWKKTIVEIIQNRMNSADITPGKLFKTKAISKSAYYARLENAGRFTLQDLKNLEKIGVKFSDDDILMIFGRKPREGG